MYKSVICEINFQRIMGENVSRLVEVPLREVQAIIVLLSKATHHNIIK